MNYLLKSCLAFALLFSVIPSQASQSLDAACDAALKTLRSGEALAANQQQHCHQLFAQYHQELTRKYSGREIQNWDNPDRTDLYVAAIKMAIIHPEAHAGWPIESVLRLHVLDELKKRTQPPEDDFTWFCAIFPALWEADTAFAVTAYERLREKDPFLADITLDWSQHFRDPYWLSKHYRANEQTENAAHVDEAMARVFFPDGIQEVTLSDFDDPPEAGLIFEGENGLTKQYGLFAGDIIVALEGYRVSSVPQYLHILNRDIANPGMNLIVWNGKAYTSIDVQLPHRRFGVVMNNYERSGK